MGTNFYFDNQMHEIHIGKRSAAGQFCHTCGMSLCSSAYCKVEQKTWYGQEAVHYGYQALWLDKCPVCGAEPKKEVSIPNAADVELFGSKQLNPREGVSSTCSFSFALTGAELASQFEKMKDVSHPVRDEYGRSYTRQEFMEIIGACKIKIYHSVGREFC